MILTFTVKAWPRAHDGRRSREDPRAKQHGLPKTIVYLWALSTPARFQRDWPDYRRLTRERGHVAIDVARRNEPALHRPRREENRSRLQKSSCLVPGPPPGRTSATGPCRAEVRPGGGPGAKQMLFCNLLRFS